MSASNRLTRFLLFVAVVLCAAPARAQAPFPYDLDTEDGRQQALRASAEWLSGVIDAVQAGGGEFALVDSSDDPNGFRVVDPRLLRAFLRFQVQRGEISAGAASRIEARYGASTGSALQAAEAVLARVRQQLGSGADPVSSTRPVRPPVPAPAAQAGAPAVAGWHSVSGANGTASPLGVDQASCLSAAQSALRAEGFADVVSQDAWATSGVRGSTHAAIACVALSGGSQVDIVVSGPSGTDGAVAAIRDALRDRLLGRIGGSRGGACGWLAGIDPTAPSDPGRGSTDAGVHRSHVLSGSSRNAHELVRARLEALRACLSRSSYAGLYADVSLRIGQTGRQVGWADGMDRNAPRSDPGRGLSSRQPHYDYVAGGGGANAPELVAARLLALRDRVTLAAYAHLYADVSVIIARASQGT